jgi:hypothetical protein
MFRASSGRTKGSINRREAECWERCRKTTLGNGNKCRADEKGDLVKRREMNRKREAGRGVARK